MNFKKMFLFIIVLFFLIQGFSQTIVSKTGFDYNPDDQITLFHDDGTAEDGTKLWYEYVHLGVKYDSQIRKGTLKVVGMQFYIVEEGNATREDLKLRIWDDDGPDGLPETILYQETLSDDETVMGWNTVAFEPTNQIIIEEGYFYCGFEGAYTSHSFGVDESSGGWSVRFVEGDWYEEDYEYMVRVIVEESSGLGDAATSMLNSLKHIYPNPFDNMFSVQYTVQAGMDETIEIVVMDIAGKRIQTLLNEKQAPGEYKIDCNASEWPSGIYFLRISNANLLDVQRIVKL